MVAVAQQAAGLVGKIFPRAEGNQMRPIPGLVLGAPEIQVRPNRVKLADNDVSALSLALSVDAFNSGYVANAIICSYSIFLVLLLI